MVPIIRREGEVTVAGPAKSVVISGGPESISERLELMDGKARTAPLAPGSYTVAVTPQDGYEVDQHEKLLEVAIQAGTNDPARTSFTITALPANVNGLVTDLNGAPLTDRQRASVTLTAADGTTTPALVNGEGRFQIGGLKPGTFTAEVRAANHETETIPALELAPGERKPLTAKLRALDGSIAGTVVDQVGAPLAGATVELLDANGEPLAQQPTVQGGAISTVSVRPGEYTARVTPPMGYGEAVDKQAVSYTHLTLPTILLV